MLEPEPAGSDERLSTAQAEYDRVKRRRNDDRESDSQYMTDVSEAQKRSCSSKDGSKEALG